MLHTRPICNYRYAHLNMQDGWCNTDDVYVYFSFVVFIKNMRLECICVTYLSASSVVPQVH